MDANQIEVAIRKLNTLATYSRDRIINDTFLKNEYATYLTRISWNNFLDVYRDLQMNCKELPTISEINTFYNRLLRSRNEEEKPQQYCPLCQGTGWALYFVEHDHSKYEMRAYCVCPAGKQYAYDFRKAEDPKMRKDLRVACISEVIDVDKLRAESQAKKNDTNTYKNAPKSLQERIKQLANQKRMDGVI